MSISNEEQVLQNALLLSYLHSKMAIKNLEVCLHQMGITHDDLLGKLQHRFEKLIQAHRNAMGIMESNIENKELLESEIEEQIDQNWDIVTGNTSTKE